MVYVDALGEAGGGGDTRDNVDAPDDADGGGGDAWEGSGGGSKLVSGGGGMCGRGGK